MDALFPEEKKIEDLASFSVEDFAHLIWKKKIKQSFLVDRLDSSRMEKKTIDSCRQKIEFAYQRLSKPLELQEKLLLMVFPFGTVNRLYENNFFDVNEEKRLGFKKRVEDYSIYSLTGLVIYIWIPIVIFFFTR